MARPPVYLTIRAAADILNVSPGYVEKLIDLGKFDGVERTATGRLKLPRLEVERVGAKMQTTRRMALDSLNEATAKPRSMEDAAADAPKHRWVKMR